jgi:wyosine [tRNA(Phe)-imidazoG37] synthetase (radical SAM superfamily)
VSIRRFLRRRVGVVNFHRLAWRRAQRWTARAFGKFEPADGDRDAMVASLARQVFKLERRAAAWRNGRCAEDELMAQLLEMYAVVDDAKIGHGEAGLRSYVDVSIQVKALRIMLDHLAPRASSTTRDLAAALVRHAPDSRPGLIVMGDLLLAADDAEGAIDVARRALRVQAVCMTAQDLLLRAYRRKRDAGSDDAELGIVDFDLSDRFCPMPFTHLSTGFQGEAFACTCPAWVPFPVGNVLDAETPDEVWNSDTAREIRRSILDGDFSHCSRTQCSYMLAQKLLLKSDVTDPILRGYIDEHTTIVTEAPRLLEVNHDPTCNLACPSCRTGIVGTSHAEQADFAIAADRILLPLMKRVEGQVYISGGGEALASKHCRSILKTLNREDFPGLSVYLITNGQLLTPKRWASLPTLPEMLSRVSISIDAARAETYAKVRRPGRWHVLMRNLEYIGELHDAGEIPELELNFVVQRENFREMLEFVALGEQIGADTLWFQRLVNYGAYDEATYADINVCSPLHPDHEELLEILRNPRLRRPSINMDMLMGLLPEFVASDEPLSLPC